MKILAATAAVMMGCASPAPPSKACGDVLVAPELLSYAEESVKKWNVCNLDIVVTDLSKKTRSCTPILIELGRARPYFDAATSTTLEEAFVIVDKDFYSSADRALVARVMSHELGHVFGLPHDPGGPSVMHEGKDEFFSTQITSRDLENFRQIHCP